MTITISFAIFFITFTSHLMVLSGAPVVWISLDGLGQSMLTEKTTPFLYNLSKQAATSLQHRPNYITKTFPNHFSAATGLNIEDHQIVGNHMVDSKLGFFTMSNNDPAWWNPNGDTFPIWTLNEMHGKQSSATIFWPGSSVAYGKKNNILPKFHIPVYDFSCGCKCRLDKAYSLMIKKEFNLVMVYIHNIDSAGHNFGTNSPQFMKTLQKTDVLVKEFFNKMSQTESLLEWNLLVSSDHGMTTLDKSKTIVLDKILPQNVKYKMIMKGCQGQLNLENKSDENKVVKLISKQIGVHMVATPKTMPEEYKYSKSSRIPDITIIMKEGWAVVENKSSLNSMVIGDHGYPAKIAPSMYAIMIAYGKDFRKNIQLKTSKMTDLFGIVCNILEIDSHCNIDKDAQGVIESIVSIAPKGKDPEEPTNSPKTTQPLLTPKRLYRTLLISFISLLLVILLSGFIYYYCYKKRRFQLCNF